MLFGLKNGPSVFQRMINSNLAHLAAFSAGYIDDIIIYSDTFKEHLKHIEAVLNQLKEMGLTLKAKKCQLARADCEYLSHRVGGGKVQPLQAKIQCIMDYPKPKKKKDLRAFLGLTNYYHQFISDYGTMAVPLPDCTRKQEPDQITWTPERDRAFEQIITTLMKKPVLMNKPFVLYTDASGVGTGAVLSQNDEDGADRPVAFFSRKLKSAETQYTVTEQECLAVVKAIHYFRVYLLGAEFTVVSDHSSLKYLDRMKYENSRLARWALSLQPYIFTVLHRPGVSNANADGLSHQSWSSENSVPREQSAEQMPASDKWKDSTNG